MEETNDKELQLEYIKAVLAECSEEYDQLEEECGFLMDLVMRKHYKNITETQFSNIQRKRNV